MDKACGLRSELGIRHSALGTRPFGLEAGMLGGGEAKGSRRSAQGKRKTEKPEHNEEEVKCKGHRVFP